MKITNNHDIPLALAVWLLHDEYDYIDRQNYISATALMKPTRMIVLGSRVKRDQEEVDLIDIVPSALGKTIHTGIETAWKAGTWQKLKFIKNIPEEAVAKIQVNPEDKDLTPDSIPVYLEQREFRKIDGYEIGGKYDMISDGILNDFKSTSAYTWLYGTRDDEHALQGSIYRWLDTKGRITHDFIRINYIFTDWQSASAKANPNYPQQRIAYKDIPLLPEARTHAWISNKLKEIRENQDKNQEDLLECPPEDLWFGTPKFKYYSNPANTAGRATRVFETMLEAQKFMESKGHVGTILTEQTAPKRCLYCSAITICNQARKYYKEDGTPI